MSRSEQLPADYAERVRESLRICPVPDSAGVELLNFLTNGYAHTAMLHSAGTKAGFIVNGRTQTPMEGYS